MESRMDEILKPKLSINQAELKNWSQTLGMDYTLQALVGSDLFDISFHTDTVKAMRGFRGTILYLNGKKILLDFWEYATPTYTSEVAKDNYDLIIKLQDRDKTFDQFMRFRNRKSLFQDMDETSLHEFYNKIVPMSFFPSRLLMPYINRENEIYQSPESHFGFFCGKSWKCRKGILEFLKNNNVEVIYSEQGVADGKTLTDIDYLKKMASCKFGIVLGGRSVAITDKKNRREIDYMMMRKPLLIDYKPFYYNPLVEGKHFIYLDDKTDLNKLESQYNIPEMVENAFQWYEENASAKGIAKVFKQIAIDRKLIV
jgi:hypothetical protein